MILADLPLRAWAALRPETRPTDVELLGPDVWRVGDVVLKLFPQADLPLSLIHISEPTRPY